MSSPSAATVPTWVSWAIAVPLTLPIFLAICILLGVLQAQLVADFKGLPHCPHDSHSLTLGRKTEKKEWRMWRLYQGTAKVGVAEDVQGGQKPRQPEKGRWKNSGFPRCTHTLGTAPLSPQRWSSCQLRQAPEASVPILHWELDLASFVPSSKKVVLILQNLSPTTTKCPMSPSN